MLQKSEIPVLHGGAVVIEPVHPGRHYIKMQIPSGLDSGYLKAFTPEEAHDVGAALMRHAKECGYDQDTGETHLVTDYPVPADGVTRVGYLEESELLKAGTTLGTRIPEVDND